VPSPSGRSEGAVLHSLFFFLMNTSLIKNRPRTAIFFISSSTLLFEVLITRIFSVTMWYHFAFMAISIAMFGMTAGALAIYLFPKYFEKDRIPERISTFSILLSVTILFSFLAHLSIPFAAPRSLSGLFSLGFNFSVISLPFIASGVLITLLLTRTTDETDVSKIYAADLAGAGLGCLGVVFILQIADAATAIVFTAFIATFGGLFFSPFRQQKKGLRRTLIGISGTMLLLTCLGGYMSTTGHSIFPLLFVKGGPDKNVIFEKWNSFSRVAIYNDPNFAESPFGWGFSDALPVDKKISQYILSIDANAATPVTHFTGNLDSIDYLKYDVTNIGHSLRPNSDVLVIGAGGGRDILSALYFKQHSVRAIEINDNILSAVTKTFGDFTGHFDKYPNVHLINDEARSYIARSKDSFDMIEISLIDTWAATAAGAYALTENALYTEEAWQVFLNHLKPNGILSLSRWYADGIPGEMYRMATLATQTLLDRGIQDPRSHVLIVKNHIATSPHSPLVGTLLISNKPFTEADIRTLQENCSQLHFDLVVLPNMTTDKHYDEYFSPNYRSSIGASVLNLTPTTDDKPFFFQMLSITNAFNPAVFSDTLFHMNIISVITLAGLLIVVLFLTIVCLVLPLLSKVRKADLKGSTMPFIYFSAIGLGFMIIEIAQIARFSVFLGHPVYGFTVSLFSLLISSGIGSLSTQSVTMERLRKRSIFWSAAILIMLLVIGFLTPAILHNFASSTTSVRIAIAAAILSIPGFFMGMAFPIGMKSVAAKFGHITPWLWGINGAMSVLASVLAIILSMEFGISFAFWTGTACYVLAAISLLRLQKN
jgi:hypothetical protein